MNWVDLTIVVIVVLSAVISLFRGFVREVLSLLAWVAAFWLAARLVRPAAALLEPVVTVEAARIVLAFMGVLIGVLLLAGVINYIVGRLLDKTGLSGPDRLLGMIFGILRGAAIVAIIVFVAGLTRLPGASWWQQARLMPPFEVAALTAVGYLPPDLAKHFSF